jgi:hypothetical protein
LTTDVTLRREMQQRALKSVSQRSNRAIASRILDSTVPLQAESEAR